MGGESDEDGEGFDVVNDFAEACIGSMRDRQLNDYSEIEETVTDALSNCVSSVMNPDATLS